jgi:TPR repeat protein
MFRPQIQTTLYLPAMLLVLSSCASNRNLSIPPPPEQPTIPADDATCVSCGSALDESAVAPLIAQANNGDSNAAFRLSAHYRSTENHEQQEQWELRAANLGHPIAQYNLWFTLRNSVRCNDRRVALAWLEKAAAQGHVEAKEMVKAFRTTTADCKS